MKIKMIPPDKDSSVLARHVCAIISDAPTAFQSDLAALATVVGMLCAATDVEVPDDFMASVTDAYNFALQLRVANRTKVASA